MWDSYNRNEGDKEAIVSQTEERCLESRPRTWLPPGQPLNYLETSRLLKDLYNALWFFQFNEMVYRGARYPWFVSWNSSWRHVLLQSKEGKMNLHLEKGWLNSGHCRCSAMSSPCFPAHAACSNAAHETETTCNIPLQPGQLHYLFSE